MSEQVNEQGGEKQLDLEYINQKFETSITDESSLKEALDFYKQKSEFESYREKAGTYEQELKDLKVYKDKYDTILQNRDKFMPDPDTIALKQLKDKYKDVDLGVLSQIRSMDLSSADKLTALVMANKLEVKSNVSDDVRKRTILKQLGIEGNLSEMEGDELAEAQFAIDNAFAQKKGKLEEIGTFQPESTYDFEADYKSLQERKEAERIDAETKSKALKEHNTKMLKPIVDGFKEMEIPYTDDNGNVLKAKYAIEDEFRKEFFDRGVEELTKNGFRITPENAPEVAAFIDKEYWYNNRDKIINSVASQVRSFKNEEFHNKNHSDSPQNKTEAPPDSKREIPLTAREQLRRGVLTNK